MMKFVRSVTAILIASALCGTVAAQENPPIYTVGVKASSDGKLLFSTTLPVKTGEASSWKARDKGHDVSLIMKAAPGMNKAVLVAVKYDVKTLYPARVAKSGGQAIALENSALCSFENTASLDVGAEQTFSGSVVNQPEGKIPGCAVTLEIESVH